MSLSFTPDVDCVLDYAARTGESPVWSAPDQALFWIDIEQPALHRFDHATAEDTCWLLPDEVGCFALHVDGLHALVGLRSGLKQLDLRSGDLTPLAPPPFNPRFFRFNEGGCDNRGRFWLGTMFDPQPPLDPQTEGQLPPIRAPWHSYTHGERLIAHMDLAQVPNGLAWDQAYRTLYIAHSKDRVIFAFDYDAERGSLSHRRVFATIPNGLGVPDGGTVDAEGCYWSALHGGGRLRRFRPDGAVDMDVCLPVSLPTKCAFGGPALDTLYVTSASGELSAQQRRDEPWAGRLLRFHASVGGLLPWSFAS